MYQKVSQCPEASEAAYNPKDEKVSFLFGVYNPTVIEQAHT